MGAYSFDHGVQYFTVRDERFEKLVDSWMQSGIVNLWEGPIRLLHNGKIRAKIRKQNRYVGTPGMSAVTRHLLDSLDIRWSTHVGSICKDGFAIVLMDEGWQPLVKSIIRIGAQLIALPGRLARSLTSGLRAVTLIFLPHTALTQIPTAAADNLFHGCHRDLVREG
jgi:predicted NAD/FAD-dependent oxidoreductase